MSCKIHCCTIFPTFVSVAGKQIIQYFIKFIIMWAMKMVEYFVSDVGTEVMYQEIIYPSMIILAVVMVFITTSISILLVWLIGKKIFSFEPCATKLMIIK